MLTGSSIRGKQPEYISFIHAYGMLASQKENDLLYKLRAAIPKIVELVIECCSLEKPECAKIQTVLKVLMLHPNCNSNMAFNTT